MIKGYFTGKTILITGVTGFLGKVLLEKLLWEVPEVEKIRLLARPVAGKGSLHQRARKRVFSSLLASPAFDRLQARHADFESFLDQKLEVFACDLLEDDLGLCHLDRKKIFTGLDAVIHIAAQVSWDERFDYSVRVNALAADKLLAYTKQMTPHPVFVHISSAYVHGQRRGDVPEEPFDYRVSIANEMGKTHPFSLEKEIREALSLAEEVMAQSRDKGLQFRFEKEAIMLAPKLKDKNITFNELIEKIRKRYIRKELSSYGIKRARLNGWIDSYTFSKAMAEMLLMKNHGQVPLAIIRPPGITSAIKEPSPGWLEGYHLVEPLIEGVGRGMIKSFPGQPEAVIDTVPVDYVVNLILAACANTTSEGPPEIYQIGTSHMKPITLKEISHIWRSYFKDNPMRDEKGQPINMSPIKFHREPDKFVRKVKIAGGLPLKVAERVLSGIPVANHWEPYRDMMAWVSRRKRQIDRVCQFSNLYSAYTVNSWIFKTENSQQLFHQLSPYDQSRFNFDVSNLDWQHFWKETHIPGMRRHVINEKN